VKQHVWQTSWAITTRSIGVMVMTHGDDKGLIVPPKISYVQVVLIPVVFKEETTTIINKCHELAKELSKAGIRCKVDDRDNYSPGWKYNHWEIKGVPLRLEIGPKDLEKKEVRAVKRNDGGKSQLKWEGLAGQVQGLLDQVQGELFLKAKANRDARLSMLLIGRSS